MEEIRYWFDGIFNSEYRDERERLGYPVEITIGAIEDEQKREDEKNSIKTVHTVREAYGIVQQYFGLKPLTAEEELSLEAQTVDAR